MYVSRKKLLAKNKRLENSKRNLVEKVAELEISNQILQENVKQLEAENAILGNLRMITDPTYNFQKLSNVMYGNTLNAINF